MADLTEQRRSGLDYLRDVTALLQRIRAVDPWWGLFEAAELQWWWAQMPRSSDDVDQLFWFDDDDRPAAAVIATVWGSSWQLDPLVLPDAAPDVVARVMARGLEHAASVGAESVELEVSRSDDILRSVLADHGLAIAEDGLAESWLAPDDRPPVSRLAHGYQLVARADAGDRPHHMQNARRNHVDPEPRLRQTSLYCPDLDLAVYAADGTVAGYGLFWHDPVTGIGVVEPMRTEDAHHGRGIARHILTSGIDLLARAGAERLKVCFEPGNETAKHLYTSAGFVPHRFNDLFAGPTARAT